MSNTDYSQMIEKLISATQFKNLEWKIEDPDFDHTFSCKVGACKVVISSIYDHVIDEDSYILELYNASGQVFKTLRYSLSEGEGLYSSLKDLFNEVRSYYYHIPESEKDIMDSLDRLIPF